MSDAQVIEVEFVASGETLTLRDTDRNNCANPADPGQTQIKSGASACLETGRAQEGADGGSVSFFVGRQQIGILSWDETGTRNWTALTKTYKTAIREGRKNGADPRRVRVRVMRRPKMAWGFGGLGSSVGHLGFAGL